MTDNELIRGIRENSAAAWRELYHRYHDRIRDRIVPMFRFTADRTFDDVFVDALVALMGHVKDGKLAEGENTNLAGYLFILCRRMALRLEEREKRRLERLQGMEEDGTDAVEEGEDGTVSPEEYEETMAFLERVLASIPPACRTILKRFYWDGMPMKDIAALMGLKNEDSAKTTKNRCMNKFKTIARAMLSDDAGVEETVRRTVERNALRDLLEEIRLEEEGSLSVAAMKEKEPTEKKEDDCR